MTATRDPGRVVIVGAGLAGYSAADQLRVLGHTGPVTVIDPEAASYDRPPLSKRLFDEDFTLDTLAFATPDKLAAKNIHTLFGRRVVAIDAEEGAVTLDDGAVLPADTILLATGGRARTLPIPGAELPGVHVLRDYADAVAIRERARPGSGAVVVGAGLIGAELASSLRRAGVEVTLIDPVAVPLTPAVGELMAAYLHEMHAGHGVDVVVGVTAAIEDAGGRLRVVVDGGPRIEADVVVIGVGIVPNTELAAAAGLDVDNGILVDEQHRTSAEGVYAAGDVARTRTAEGMLHRREEHWEAAQLGGQRAAYGMLGLDAPARGTTWFWSDRHGIHLEAAGRLTGPGEIVVRDHGAHPAVFLLDDGLVAGAAAIDDTTTVRVARRLIEQRIPVTAAELSDPAVSLRSLLKATR